ncbi:unnamed protein product [Orchesella dallaii]|uniref:Uncharacterized protein n=1 Tax=Orchesella dallaii TaxID=48710 RepID=A0ABP1PSR2_9HEXA
MTTFSNEEIDGLPVVKGIQASEEDMADFNKLIENCYSSGNLSDEKPGVLIHTPESYKPTRLSPQAFDNFIIGQPQELYLKRVSNKQVYELARQDFVRPSANKAGLRSSSANKTFTVKEFRERFGNTAGYAELSPADLHDAFWKNLRLLGENSRKQNKFLRLCVYGTDVDGTLFEVFSEKLTLHNLNTILVSVTKKYFGGAVGIDSPMLYVAVEDSTFPAHEEDLDLLAVSYLHFGAPKIWYTVPPAYSAEFEEVVKTELEAYMKKHWDHSCANPLRHKNIIVDILCLKGKQIPVHIIVQNEGDLVILAPRTYHFGFNAGFNVAEAVNFAHMNWFIYGLTAHECVHLSKTLTMELFVYEHKFSLYQQYIDGELEMQDPISKGTTKIPAPILNLVSIQDLHYIIFNGVSEVLCTKTQEDTECAYIEVAGTFVWVTRMEAQLLKWRHSEKLVNIPDNFYEKQRKTKPPIWNLRKALEYEQQQMIVTVLNERSTSNGSCPEAASNSLPMDSVETTTTSQGSAVPNPKRLKVRTETQVREVQCCPFPGCTVTNLNYKESNGFQKHVNSHTIKYSCDQCSKVYIKKQKLKEHIRRKHQQPSCES